jgi:hypothetical protein
MLDTYREDEKYFQLALEEYQPLEHHNLIPESSSELF